MNDNSDMSTSLESVVPVPPHNSHVPLPQSSPNTINISTPTSSHAAAPSSEPSTCNQPILASRLRQNMLKSGAAAFAALQEAAEKVKDSVTAAQPPALTTYQQHFVNFMSGAMSALPPEKQQQLIQKTMEFYLELNK